MTTVPMFEAKNKLPLFMHQAEAEGPVFISRRNKTVGVLISFDDYNRMVAKGRRKTAGLITNEEIDKIFDVRDHSVQGTSWENDVFKGVFDD